MEGRLTKLEGRFALGKTVSTRGAMDEFPIEEVTAALARHAEGDWGDVDAEDARANDEALASEGRLLSEYRTRAGRRFWIVTEADRSATTVLLPEEY